MLKLPSGNAICYSGYRRGQSPGEKVYPSVAEIREDLRILHRNWRLLRLYDCSLHAERVLNVIRADRLDFKVMLGAYLAAEMNNFGCPWGATYSEEQLAENRAENDAEVERLIALARRHDDIVFSVAVGNEATVDWTDHYVPLDRMIELVRRARLGVPQPVTFCENYVPWQDKLRDLVRELDFISLHTYPVWEYKHVHDALHYSKDNYHSVAHRYPDKPVVITEAGWATNANGRGIDPGNTSEDLQAIYYADLMDWTQGEGILTFVFEAFDEPWKGSPDPMDPEKHWGLFTVDREPKKVMQPLYPEMIRGRQTAHALCGPE
jgi:exo-beta-1,3-glucanase (GH17 family)